MEIEIARHNMIEQQIRTWEVFDQNILDTIQALPREDFMPTEFRQLALADTCIPLAHGQQTMAPKTEARMLQSLDLKPADKVLEIGTGSGYVTALLGKLCREVISLDIFPDFTENAESRLRQHGINNVQLINKDGISGYREQAPYDAIVITGSISKMIDDFRLQLAEGGRLFVIIGISPVMEATLFTRSSDVYSRTVLYETDAPALIGAESTPAFEV